MKTTIAQQSSTRPCALPRFCPLISLFSSAFFPSHLFRHSVLPIPIPPCPSSRGNIRRRTSIRHPRPPQPRLPPQRKSCLVACTIKANISCHHRVAPSSTPHRGQTYGNVGMGGNNNPRRMTSNPVCLPFFALMYA